MWAYEDLAMVRCVAIQFFVTKRMACSFKFSFWFSHCQAEIAFFNVLFAKAPLKFLLEHLFLLEICLGAWILTLFSWLVIIFLKHSHFCVFVVVETFIFNFPLYSSGDCAFAKSVRAFCCLASLGEVNFWVVTARCHILINRQQLRWPGIISILVHFFFSLTGWELVKIWSCFILMRDWSHSFCLRDVHRWWTRIYKFSEWVCNVSFSSHAWDVQGFHHILQLWFWHFTKPFYFEVCKFVEHVGSWRVLIWPNTRLYKLGATFIITRKPFLAICWIPLSLFLQFAAISNSKEIIIICFVFYDFCIKLIIAFLLIIKTRCRRISHLHSVHVRAKGHSHLSRSDAVHKSWGISTLGSFLEFAEVTAGFVCAWTQQLWSLRLTNKETV